MLNAIRFRFTKRSRSKKPDWLLDKYPSRSRSKSTPSEEVSPTASTANILCSRLSVDPSLPSHYRVSRHIFQYQISPAANTHSPFCIRNENCVHIVIIATGSIQRAALRREAEQTAEINVLYTGLIGRPQQKADTHVVIRAPEQRLKITNGTVSVSNKIMFRYISVSNTKISHPFAPTYSTHTSSHAHPFGY